MLPADDPRPQQWDASLRTSLTTGIGDPGASALIGGVDNDIDEIRASVLPPGAVLVHGRRARGDDPAALDEHVRHAS